MLFYSFFYLEYNPKLSEATPSTRVAYVKFMAGAMRREQANDDKIAIINEKKSILKTSNTAKEVYFPAPFSFL